MGGGIGSAIIEILLNLFLWGVYTFQLPKIPNAIEMQSESIKIIGLCSFIFISPTCIRQLKLVFMSFKEKKCIIKDVFLIILFSINAIIALSCLQLSWGLFEEFKMGFGPLSLRVELDFIQYSIIFLTVVCIITEGFHKEKI